MRDRSKTLTVINTGERKKSSESSVVTQYVGGGGGGSSPNGVFLEKSIWDKVWEIRTTEDGEEYIFGKLPVALQYGLTSFVDGGNLELQDIYDGLTIDNQTIYWEETIQETTDEEGNVIIETIKVLKAKGGSGEGTISDISITGSGNAITDVSLNSDKTGLIFTKGLTFAEKSYLDENFFNKTYVNENFYTKKQADDKFVTLATSQTITGTKNFTGGLQVNGCELVYDSVNKYWKLEGDLLVTGGISSFADSTAFSPSTIMDALVTDETTITKKNGVLEVIGGTGGGSVDEDAVKELIESYNYLTADKLPIATTSVKGIASFDSSSFSVSNGLVSFSGGKVKVVDDEPSSYESNTLYVIVG